MHILLTVISLVVLIGCLIGYTRSQREADAAESSRRLAEGIATRLRAERDRVTVLERELDALRRELRKLSGKFYASQRELPAENAPTPPSYGDGNPRQSFLPLCENYALAQREGPTSKAARCECVYCLTKRAERDAIRHALVPKTVRGQAEMAKLNGGQGHE